ncbi:hypothetical protein DdX_10781 [Ditylenchus destructor]|uniref:Uncharacterized protein n=1 Tax=Ditylenchus destructor TaxID=166010 RepID=A0AAD4R581_9BILA|nr:hypothetical protein DdX_10781 [Ditylenchus destructor]
MALPRTVHLTVRVQETTKGCWVGPPPKGHHLTCPALPAIALPARLLPAVALPGFVFLCLFFLAPPIVMFLDPNRRQKQMSNNE